MLELPAGDRLLLPMGADDLRLFYGVVPIKSNSSTTVITELGEEHTTCIITQADLDRLKGGK